MFRIFAISDMTLTSFDASLKVNCVLPSVSCPFLGDSNVTLISATRK